MRVRSQNNDMVVDVSRFRLIRVVDSHELPENIRAGIKPISTRYQVIVTDSIKSNFSLLHSDYLCLGGYEDLQVAQAMLDVIQNFLCYPDIELLIMPPETAECRDIEELIEVWKHMNLCKKGERKC